MDELQKLIDLIGKKNVMQGKYLRGTYSELSEKEISDANKLIKFYEAEGKDLSTQTNAYLMFVNDTLEETKYFFEHDDYRYHSIAEVANKVYFNQEYMSQYMLGLGISLYLWPQHNNCLRFFTDVVQEIALTSDRNEKYLEIGPGHGKFFVEAVEQRAFAAYTAMDISETSINFTKKMVMHFLEDKSDKISFICRDVNEVDDNLQYDFITMCEVLEHVEQPLALLKKIYSMLSIGGKAFISVPVNAPVIDHIYLFRTKEAVFEMVYKAGFKIINKKAFCTKGTSLIKAEKCKDAILVALLLEK